MANKNNPTSFRLPFTLPESVDPHVHSAIRWMGNSLKDLNDAIAALAERPTVEKTKIITQEFDIGETIGRGPIVRDTAAVPTPWRKRWFLWETAWEGNEATAGTFKFRRLNDDLVGTGGTTTRGKTTNGTDDQPLGMTWYYNSSVSGLDYAADQPYYCEYGHRYYSSAREGNVFETRIRAWLGTLNVRCWIGMATQALTGTILDTTVGANWDFIGFYFKNGYNWQCVCGTNLGMTMVDSGIPVDFTYRTLRIETHGTYATFFIDDRQIAQIGDNYPLNKPLCINVGIRGARTTQGYIDAGIAVEYAYGEALR